MANIYERTSLPKNTVGTLSYKNVDLINLTLRLKYWTVLDYK